MMRKPQTTTSAHQYPLLWLLLTGITALALMVAVDQSLMSAIFAADRSYLCILILIIFAGASGHVGLHTYAIACQLERADDLDRDGGADSGATPPRNTATFGLMPQQIVDDFADELRCAGNATQAARQQTLEVYADRLRAPVELGWYIVDILIRLGLIGTIIGFIMIFASINQGQTPSSDNIQSLLLSMSGGMGTALYTTLLGLISATLLGTQHMILGRSVEQLIARLIHLGHIADPAGQS